MALYANIPLALAIRSAIVARGAGAVVDGNAAADLMKDCGAPIKEVLKARAAAMPATSIGGRRGW